MSVINVIAIGLATGFFNIDVPLKKGRKLYQERKDFTLGNAKI